MRPKRSPAPLELTAVLLVTVLALAWGRVAARAERGGDGVGGEFLLMFLPAVYYIGKRTVLDWVADLRQLWEEGGMAERTTAGSALDTPSASAAGRN